jgi:lipoprotein-anchoring transpeptidase ErfK/SrfK
MKKYVFIFLTIVLLGILFVFFRNNSKVSFDVKLKEIDINVSYKTSDIVTNIRNGLLTNDEEVIFDSLGNKEVLFNINDKYGNRKEYTINVSVIDKESPTINAKDEISIIKGKKIDLLKNVTISDNSREEIIPEVIGEYNINKEGKYKLKYKATDSSGNSSELDFVLIVKNDVKKTSNNKYYVKVNKTKNVVMVYTLDGNNNYSILTKTFVCSAGENTPVGVYTIDAKAETLALEGGVYGHYTTRFLKSRGMWFHSVPYFSKPSVDNEGNKHWDNLEYEEYNKLGETASLGCIRLSTIDAKWIYNNVSIGSTVEIYESDTLPEGVVKPTPIKIDVTSENKGWDPTDPDPENPWNN